MAWATLSYVAPLPERETAVPYARRSRRPTPGGRHPGREAGFASAGPFPAPPGGGAGRRGGHAARWLSASCSSRGTCCSARSSAASWPPPAPKCPGTREPVILPCWSWAVPGRRTGSASSYDAGFRCLPTAHTFRWSCCARHAKLVRRRSRTLRWKHGCRISFTHRAQLASQAVSFAESGAAPIFPSHDALHHRRTAPPGRARAGEAVLRGAGTERRRVRGEGRAGFPGPARSRWGGDRAARVGGCRGQDPRARLHPLLRSGAGSLPFDPPARSHCGSRVTAVGERFAVRVMVTDVWDQVFLAVEFTTTVADVKRQALTQALKRAQVRSEDYVVKFRGAQVLDESTNLAALGAVPNSPFIILPARRHAVR